MTASVTRSKLDDFCLERGVTAVGIAGVEAFQGAPAGHGPRDLLPQARAVISMGIMIPERLLAWPELIAGSAVLKDEECEREMGRHIYRRCGYDVINDFLEQVAFELTLWLEGAGCKSIYLPATFGAEGSELIHSSGYFGPFSHRHAAVRAGLGEFGYNGLVVTRDYGPRMRFVSVITTADMKLDEPVEEQICRREECGLCLEACPASAFWLREDLDQSGVFINPPSAIDAEYCQKTQAHSDCMGRCIRVCPVGST